MTFPNAEKVDLQIQIKRVADGVVSTVVRPDWDWYDGVENPDPLPYWWTDGNAACDCNRHGWFQEGFGLPEDEEHPCGDAEYEVQLIDLKTGKLLYTEFET